MTAVATADMSRISVRISLTHSGGGRSQSVRWIGSEGEYASTMLAIECGLVLWNPHRAQYTECVLSAHRGSVSFHLHVSLVRRASSKPLLTTFLASENQFFVTSTTPGQGDVQNLIGQAIVTPFISQVFSF